MGEVLARRITPVTPRTYAPSPTRGWKPLPHLDITWSVPAFEGGDPGPVRIRTDSHGFRGGRETGSKRPGVFRVAVIGDSFTFGVSVHEEHLYTAVIERTLLGRTSSRVEVVNLGVPGYGVHQEHVTLIEQGLPLDPDLVVVSLYPGNDLQETLGLHRRVFDPKTGGTLDAPDHRIIDGRMVPVPAGVGAVPGGHGSLMGWLRDHLRLYSLIVERLKGNETLHGWPTRIGLIRRERPVALPEPARAEHLWGGYGMVSLLRDTPPALEDAWRILLGHLDAMHSACRSRGIPMAVVVIPYKIQVVPAARRREETLVAVPERDLDLEQPGRRIQRWASARGVPLIDLLPVFRDASDPASLYFRVDAHWNDRGHEFAGRALAERLLSDKLLPAESR